MPRSNQPGSRPKCVVVLLIGALHSFKLPERATKSKESMMESNTIRTRYVKSSEAARRLGISPKTLAKWRYQRKGPGGWIYASATLTLYPEKALEAFIEERAKKIPVFNFRIRDRRG